MHLKSKYWIASHAPLYAKYEDHFIDPLLMLQFGPTFYGGLYAP